MRALTFGSLALLTLAAPASAGTIVTYTGHTTDFDQQGFGGGNRDFIARYSYADDGSMEWASMAIAGLPTWQLACPREFDTEWQCEPLVLTANEIASTDWWSIEDVAIVSVRPAGGFGTLPWPDGKFVYQVKPGETTTALVGVSDFLSDCGYCYFTGTGVVDRVSFGFGVPEPGTWGLMLAGFGMLEVSLRRRRVVA